MGANIYLQLVDPTLHRTVTDLCLLAGSPVQGEVSAGFEDKLDEGCVVFSQSGCQTVSAGTAIEVKVGLDGDDQADLRLPSEGAALLSLVRSLKEKGNRDTQNTPVVLVCSWHGGGGVTTFGFNLARHLGSPLVCCSSAFSFPRPAEDDGLGWDSLDPNDLPSGRQLVRGLPKISQVPVLTGQSAPGPKMGRGRMSQGELVSLLSSLPDGAVVDCGTDVVRAANLWDRLVQAGADVFVAVVGRGDDRFATGVDRSLKALSVDAGASVAVFLSGNASTLFKMVLNQFGIVPTRVPKRWNKKQAAKFSQRVLRLGS